MPDTLPYCPRCARAARSGALEPGNARFACVYAVALHSTGRAEEAIARLKKPLQTSPNHRDILAALVSFHKERGEDTVPHFNGKYGGMKSKVNVSIIPYWTKVQYTALPLLRSASWGVVFCWSRELFHRARLIPDCLASLRLGSGHALADKK